MSKTLQQLVSELPEIYQPIYGYQEWSQNVSRACFDRLEVLGAVYDRLVEKLGRPLRVLDLGCAQGFFCLSLAARGATVKGVDFQEENIALCRWLAQENSDLAVSFEKARIEDVIDALKSDEYDLAIGLSVFHHIVHLHSIVQVQHWLYSLADRTEAVVLELALRDEPLYWGASQPEDPRELINDCVFYHQIGSFGTHLSNISRPLYCVSNKWLLLGEHCAWIEQWRDWPYHEAQGAHKGSRRYYFGADFFCKVFNYNIRGGTLSFAESERNRAELERETAFLQNPPEGFVPPACLGHGLGESDGWLMMERLSGELLLDKLKSQEPLDHETLFDTLLEQLEILERAGLYHDDVRSWNILINGQGKARLIDCGSITKEKTDCVWPNDPFQAFFILANEIFSVPEVKINLLRPFALAPFNLPSPYAEWLFAFWQLPVDQWSFKTLRSLFNAKQRLLAMQPQLSGCDLWVAAMEHGLQQLQVYLQHNIEPGMRVQLGQNKESYAQLQAQLKHVEVGAQTKLRQNKESYEQLQAQLKHVEVGAQTKLRQNKESYEQLQAQLKRVEVGAQTQLRQNEMSYEQLQIQLKHIEVRVQAQLHESEERYEQWRQHLQALNEERGLPAPDLDLRVLLSETQANNSRLVETLERAGRHLEEQTQLSQTLTERLESISVSRSWRLMAPYRYVGNQLKLLRQHGIKGRCKQLGARVLKASYARIRQRPRIKTWLVNGLDKTGYYPQARKLYSRLYPQDNHNIEEGPVAGSQQMQLESQLVDLSCVPTRVRDIFQQLNDKNKG